MYIKNIRIRNFRSIVKSEIELNDMSIFVGFNDVGKSNILKALNLFFNNESDYNGKFDFEADYCKHSPLRQKMAEEIIIEIVFLPPTNYKQSQEIIWKKVWRKYGFHKPGERINFNDGSSFPERSKLYAWLENIRYTYVPAIRDNSFFQTLLANLHDSLAETIESELKSAGDEFIKKIKSNTLNMIKDLDTSLKINSQIKLPSNLQALFKTLDFSTNEGGFQLSLSNRGDGIKTRHIPFILKFIADQLNINRTKGSPNVSMIWGYEEPENNLEMLAAFDLANNFIEYANDIQLLITTHSPGFYYLKNQFPQKVNLFKVVKEKNKVGEIIPLKGYDDLDYDMGIMPIIAPHINAKVIEIKSLQKDIDVYKKNLSKYNKNVIFVEGDDEVRIYEKIVQVCGLSDKIDVQRNAFGCTGVREQLMSWAWISGFSAFKAVGIFDLDKSGKNEKFKIEGEPQYQKASSNGKVKAVIYTVPKHLQNIKQKIGDFPIELEEMYPPKVWALAKASDWIVPRGIDEIRNFVSLDNLFQTYEEKIRSLGLNTEEIMYITHKIPDNYKDNVSRALIKKDNKEFAELAEPIKLFFETKIKILLSN